MKAFTIFMFIFLVSSATNVVGFHCFKNCPCIHPPCADGAPSAFSAVAADIPSAAVSAATAAIPAAPVENDNN